MNHVIYPTAPYEELPNIPTLKIIRSKKEIEESYAAYLMDESRLPGGHADGLVFAHSEKQVVEVLRQVSISRMPVTVSAGRTGIVGGAVPSGGILLSLENMNRFLGARWDDENSCWCVRVQPGLSVENLQNILKEKDFAHALSLLKGGAREDIERFSMESDCWFYPPDPTEKSAHLGGTVATNASGARSLKYGQTREFVVSLRVVLADGNLLSVQRGVHVATSEKSFHIQKEKGVVEVPIPSYRFPKVKNTSGYYVNRPMDFIDFFIGSEGTLGVITEMELALRRKPEFILCGVAFFSSEDKAIKFIKLIREKKEMIEPTALEYFDPHSLQLLKERRDQAGQTPSIPPFPEYAQAAVYFEQEGKEEDVEKIYAGYDALLCECGTSMEETWGGMDEKELGRMTDFRHALPEAVNTIVGQRQKSCSELHKVGTDFVVPDSGLEQMIYIYRSTLDAEKLEYVIFGHIGENHLHLNILPRNTEELDKAKKLYLEFAREAVSMGGTVSGEHGIGKIKKSLLRIMYTQNVIDEMQKVKESIDPEAILGPGNLF